MESTRQLQVYLTNPEGYVHGDPANVYISDNSEMENHGWVRLAAPDVILSHPLPSRDEMRGKTVAQIRDQIKQIDAAAMKAKTELEGKIQNLLAIGHDTTAEG
jgi:hypothetical protein